MPEIQVLPEELARRLMPSYYFSMSTSELDSELVQCSTVFEMKARWVEFVAERARRDIRGTVHARAEIDGDVFVDEGAVIEANACVSGPVWIGRGAIVRHGAFIRDHTYLDSGAVVGHASEVARSLLRTGSRAAHFGYVGDSVLGSNSNLGSHVVTTNLKLEHEVTEPAVHMIHARVGEVLVDTGYTKFGSVVGDNTRIAAGVSLSPATLIGPNSQVLRGRQLGGTVPAFSRIWT